MLQKIIFTQPIRRRQSKTVFTDRNHWKWSGFGLVCHNKISFMKKMFLFLRIQAGCPYMPTCCFLLTEDDYQQFSAQVP